MTYTETVISGIWIIESKVLKDTRGHFMKTFKQAEFEGHIRKTQLMQDNESYSSKDVLRGLHHQLAPYSQSKLARAIKGWILDIAIDVREGSPTLDKYVAVKLSDENKRQLFIPQGFAHGFHILSDKTIFIYKVDNPYTPTYERGTRYDDPTVHVDWNITGPESINLPEKGTKAPLLKDVELNFRYQALYRYESLSSYRCHRFYRCQLH